jgi:hypothetical protein
VATDKVSKATPSVHPKVDDLKIDPVPFVVNPNGTISGPGIPKPGAKIPPPARVVESEKTNFKTARTHPWPPIKPTPPSNKIHPLPIP